MSDDWQTEVESKADSWLMALIKSPYTWIIVVGAIFVLAIIL